MSSGFDTAGPGPLTLLRWRPDLERLARWVEGTGQRELRGDLGYALHGALAAALGTLAPRPFALQRRQGDTVEVLGYTRAAVDDVRRAVELPAFDPLAAAALNLASLSMTTLPSDWRAGERLSFEVRVAPVVRSRRARPGAVVEVDAAWHDSCAAGRLGDRMHAYGEWLARELAREGAARLQGWTLRAFELSLIARRGQRAADAKPRTLSHGLLPDLTVRGTLTVGNGAAFDALLARGLGRHRAFGFGCLLLAAAGVLHRQA